MPVRRTKSVRSAATQLSQMDLDPPTKSQLSRKTSSLARSASFTAKKRKTEKLTITFPTEKGSIFTFGQNDVGQLGLSIDDAPERRYPARVVEMKDKVLQIAAGAMHTVVLTDKYQVMTFGCNDDCALGRQASEEEEIAKPGLVAIKEKVIQVTAGDSHSAALTESGKAYYWGSFRDNSGNIGLKPGVGNTMQPTLIKFGDPEPKIVKLASGSNHLVALTDDGEVYALGNGEFGQLGRYITSRTLRSRTKVPRTDAFLEPGKVVSNSLKNVSDIWAGGDMTFCKQDDEIWAFGMNASSQLGWPARHAHGDEPFDNYSNCHFVPRKSPGFNSSVHKPWKEIAMGERHVIALNHAGKVFALGDARDGRLGLGDDFTEHSEPIMIPQLANETCTHVACGGSTSYAITSSGRLFAWGFCENLQLAIPGDEDANIPTLCRGSRNEDGIKGKVVYVAAGSQHAALVNANAPPLSINNNNDDAVGSK